MIIKKQEFKTCSKCGNRKMVSGEEYGCDICKKPIDFNKPPDECEHLSMTIFYRKSDNAKDLHFCSWECAFQRLMTIKKGDFISLPYLILNVRNQKVGIEGFREAIRNIRRRDE